MFSSLTDSHVWGRDTPDVFPCADPLSGGISKDWYRLAYIRRFPADSCSGSKTGREGLFPEACAWKADASWQYPFASDTKVITTKLDRIPTQMVGPATTMQAPGFVYAVAQGNSTGLGQRNCLTVSLISNVALTSGATATYTKFTISGLGTAQTASTETLDLYQSNAACVGFDNKQPTPGMGTQRSGALQSVAAVPTKDQAKFDKAKGTLEFQLDAGQYIQAGELIAFTFALDNPEAIQDNQKLFIQAEVHLPVHNMLLK
jgi:hypothetical protein